jgi:3-deoxy-7-phosphoheptulonate synthase
MLVVMDDAATAEQIDAVVRHIESLGLKALPIPGAYRTAVCVTGQQAAKDPTNVENFPGVKEVILVTQPYKLVSREAKPDDTIVDVGGVDVGGNGVVVVGGPCAVESLDQTRTIAEGVKRAGGQLFRGGAYKPRTSPYSFQGLGEPGLEILARVREEFDLPIITEAIDHESLQLVDRYADCIQIGARNMQNFALLKALGACGRPVLLKRGMSSTIRELLMSAEYIVAHGNPNVILCERGIRTFETVTRNTCDIAAIAALGELTHLPVILDPSNATGKRSLVPALCRAGVAIGADGLLVEVHPWPEKAISDGAQSLDLSQFRKMMQDLRPYLDLWKESPVTPATAAV